MEHRTSDKRRIPLTTAWLAVSALLHIAGGCGDDAQTRRGAQGETCLGQDDDCRAPLICLEGTCQPEPDPLEGRFICGHPAREVLGRSIRVVTDVPEAEIGQTIELCAATSTPSGQPRGDGIGVEFIEEACFAPQTPSVGRFEGQPPNEPCAQRLTQTEGDLGVAQTTLRCLSSGTTRIVAIAEGGIDVMAAVEVTCQ